MLASDLDLRFQVAQSVVRDSGKLAAEYYRRRTELVVDAKGAQDLVSEADKACEEVIVAALSRSFPEDSFLGEEGGLRKPGGEAIWVIDPIDGTANFLRGIPFWCVSLALVMDGDSVLGLIYDPIADELFAARRGGGARLNGVPIKVTGETRIDRARICVGFSYRRPLETHIRAIETCLAAECEYSRLGSGALGLAYTADGRFDGYWEAHTNSWDAGAGIVLVREAGGWTNHFLAGDGLMKGNEILGVTPDLAEPLARLTGFAGRNNPA